MPGSPGSGRHGTQNGLSFLLDFLGITDIVNCFTKADIGACISAAAGMIPVTKIFSMAGKTGKGIWKAFQAWKAWKAAVKWADDILAKTRDRPVGAPVCQTGEPVGAVGHGATRLLSMPSPRTVHVDRTA